MRRKCCELSSSIPDLTAGGGGGEMQAGCHRSGCCLLGQRVHVLPACHRLHRVRRLGNVCVKWRGTSMLVVSRDMQLSSVACSMMVVVTLGSHSGLGLGLLNASEPPRRGSRTSCNCNEALWTARIVDEMVCELDCLASNWDRMKCG